MSDEKVTVRTEFIRQDDGTYRQKQYVGEKLIAENDCWCFRRTLRPYFVMVPIGELPWEPYGSEIREQMKFLELATLHRRLFTPQTTALVKESPKALVLWRG